MLRIKLVPDDAGGGAGKKMTGSALVSRGRPPCRVACRYFFLVGWRFLADSRPSDRWARVIDGGCQRQCGWTTGVTRRSLSTFPRWSWSTERLFTRDLQFGIGEDQRAPQTSLDKIGVRVRDLCPEALSDECTESRRSQFSDH